MLAVTQVGLAQRNPTSIWS